jgi:hypothetical protein
MAEPARQYPWPHLVFVLPERTSTRSRCPDVPTKGNDMMKQNEPRQQNQSPGRKPAQQQGGGQKPGQQRQAPANDDKDPREPHWQTSDTDT